MENENAAEVMNADDVARMLGLNRKTVYEAASRGLLPCRRIGRRCLFFRPAMLLALRTGLRQGELFGLRWEDVDLVAGRLMVNQAISRGVIGTPKSGRSREVPLSEQAVAALKKERHLRGPFVFCDADGHPLRQALIKTPLWRACRRAGLRRVQWHVLRHTFASHLAMRGVPLKAVQELLGHSTMDMTMRYAHLSPSVRRDAVQCLDGAVPNGRQILAGGGGEAA